MSPTIQKLEREIKKLPPKQQVELFELLETLIHDAPDRVSYLRHEELVSGSVLAITEEDMRRRLHTRQK